MNDYLTNKMEWGKLIEVKIFNTQKYNARNYKKNCVQKNLVKIIVRDILIS